MSFFVKLSLILVFMSRTVKWAKPMPIIDKKRSQKYTFVFKPFVKKCNNTIRKIFFLKMTNYESIFELQNYNLT